MPWCPGCAPQHSSAAPCPQKIPHRTQLPSVAHGEAEEPLSGGTPRSSPPSTNPPLPPALSPANPGGPRVAPLGRVSDTAGPVPAAPSPASIRPPWESLQSARPRAPPGPPGSRLLGRGLQLLQLPDNGEVAGGSHSPQATGCISQGGHIPSQLSGTGLSPEQPRAQGPAVRGLGFLVVVCFPILLSFLVSALRFVCGTPAVRPFSAASPFWLPRGFFTGHPSPALPGARGRSQPLAPQPRATSATGRTGEGQRDRDQTPLPPCCH